MVNPTFIWQRDNLKFIWAGRVTVDSGMLAVADPGYWSDERLGYENLIETAEDPETVLPYELGNLDHVGASMALVFPTIQGDGIYDVYTVWDEQNVIGFFASFVDDDFAEAEDE